MKKKILIIDDDVDMCGLLSRFLERKGFETAVCHSGHKGLARFREDKYDVVLCDFRLGDMDGVKVLQGIRESGSAAIVIIITGYSDIKMAVEVMRQGAFDYITKPLVPEEVITIIHRGLSADTNETGIVSPADKKIKNRENAEGDEFLTGIAPLTKEMYRQIDLVAPTNYSVILYGESGTGKEVIAKTIHKRSQRTDKPFMAVDCGTLSRELAASELFGHVKGSFTGALSDKEGFFEAANGGTLFLDEVANLPLDVQATLLRVIQERKFKRVGSNKDMDTDVRVIVASNENLQEAYKRGRFREDLYHRFNEFSINIPPLRARKEDIGLFSAFFLAKACGELNKESEGFEEEVMQLFMNYDWPGNLREFRNVIRRAALLTPSGRINTNVLPWEIIGSSPMTKEKNIPAIAPAVKEEQSEPVRTIAINGLKDAAAQAEYNTIMEVLKEVKFNKTKAAGILNIDRKTLYNKIKQYEALMVDRQ
ncbi:MAG: sigma-54 dependent transcriptional regulator [Chitinophagaceae bacterium]